MVVRIYVVFAASASRVGCEREHGDVQESAKLANEVVEEEEHTHGLAVVGPSDTVRTSNFRVDLGRLATRLVSGRISISLVILISTEMCV